MPDLKPAEALLPTGAARVTRNKRSVPRALFGLLVLLASSTFVYTYLYSQTRGQRFPEVVPYDAKEILAKCRALHLKPGPPADFYSRTQSDRYQQGTGAVLVRNATIWSGVLDGTQIIHGDVLLDKGIIKHVGALPAEALSKLRDVHVIEAEGYVLFSVFVCFTILT